MTQQTIDWTVLIHQFRQQEGLKQEAAAQILGVSQATLSRWESGRSTPTVGVQNRLLKKLRRTRSPDACLHWISTFQKLFHPGAIINQQRMMLSITESGADALGASPDMLKGLCIDDFFVGELTDARDLASDAGFFSGRVLSFEAIRHVEVRKDIMRGVSLFYHSIDWPYVLETGEIIEVSQGRLVTKEEAMDIRARLRGREQFTYAD